MIDIGAEGGTFQDRITDLVDKGNIQNANSYIVHKNITADNLSKHIKKRTS